MKSRVTVLVENTAADESTLESEHGLSLYIETPETKFIFDCGHTGLAWENAEKMGIDLQDVKMVVLSHSHYDHGGGFPALLKYCQPKTLYTGRNFWQEKYSYDKESGEYLYKGCGFTADDLAKWQVEQKVCVDSLPIDDYASIITGFDRQYTFEDIPEKFCRGGQKEADPFNDEICLLLKEGDGLAMVVGCSHRGILNMVAAVKNKTGQPVRRIIGGIHLSKASKERMEQTLPELRSLGVQELNLCHCSGAEVPGRISTGSVIEIG